MKGTPTMSDEQTIAVMSPYIGTKMIKAKPMNHSEAQSYLGRGIPQKVEAGQKPDPNEAGYLVEYEDGYESWSPADVFNKAYRSYSSLTFGMAIMLLKKGMRVARHGWNGKDMFLYYQLGYPTGVPLDERTAKSVGGVVGASAIILPSIWMSNVNGNLVPWLASQSDMLADDWHVVY